jgi:hypothetical protein
MKIPWMNDRDTDIVSESKADGSRRTKSGRNRIAVQETGRVASVPDPITESDF